MRYAAIIVAATQSAINVQAVSIPQTLAISANFDQVEEEDLVPQQMVLAQSGASAKYRGDSYDSRVSYMRS